MYYFYDIHYALIFLWIHKIAIKISADIIEIDKLTLKLTRKYKEHRLASILNKDKIKELGINLIPILILRLQK